MSQIYNLFLMGSILHQTAANLNIWVTQKMLADIVRNLPMANGSGHGKVCPPEMTESLLSAPFPDRLPLVQDGTRVQYVHFKISNSVIPPTIKQVFVMWNSSTKHIYTIEAKSRNLTLMHPPMLNVPDEGSVPNSPSALTLSLPCTGFATGLTPVDIKLNITEKYPRSRKMKAKPSVIIKDTVYKSCLSKRDRRRLQKFILRCQCKNKCRTKRRPRCCMKRCRRRHRLTKNVRGRKRCKKRRRRRKGKKSKDHRKRKRKSRKRKRKRSKKGSRDRKNN